jgi:uncharacterized protein (TIGR02271 family)
MFDRTGIREGMVVRSSDGEKLGKVFAVGEDAFHIEKGLFFPKDYVARFSDVTDIRDGEIILAHGRDRLRSADEATFASTSTSTAATTGLGTENPAYAREGFAGTATQRTDSDREVSVPVAREELDVVKREREAGQVRITKEVVTEEQELSVPVRKERVRVERRDVGESRPAMSASFRDETIVVPLREEQGEVEKRARINEEVVVHKDAVEEQRRVAEKVRREQVDVSTQGDVEDVDRSRSGYRAPDDDPLKRT